VVEDEFVIAMAFSQQLEHLGYEVVGTARNGAEGVAEAIRLRPDVVLMDIGLPGMDGIEACRKIMAVCPLPIVMLTAYDDEERLSEAQEAGAMAYLLKPATEAQLRDVIEKALSQSRIAESADSQP